jgi:hypothetical protein
MQETSVRSDTNVTRAILRLVAGALGCLLICLAVGPAIAETTAPEADPLNHAFSVYLGSGIYVSENRSVFIFRIAPRIKILSEKDRKFGIRLRLNATFGFYDFDPKDLIELEFPDRLGTFAFVPGIEFPVNMYDNWVLIPFFDVGPATDTNFQDLNVVLGVGFRSRAEWHHKRFAYLLWNELIYAKNLETKEYASEDYSMLRSDFETRGLARYRLGKRPFDFGLLLGIDWFFDTIIVNVPFDQPEPIGARYEVGFTTGPSQPWRQLKKIVKVPRLGLSYRFGQGSSSVRFLISSRY